MPEPRKGFFVKAGEHARETVCRLVERENAKRAFRRESAPLQAELAGVGKQIAEAERILTLVKEAQATRARLANGPRKRTVQDVLADGSGLFNNAVEEAERQAKADAERFLAEFEPKVSRIEAELDSLRAGQSGLLERVEELRETHGLVKKK